MTERQGFLLLEPGPLVPDEAHQRGDADLLTANRLDKIGAAVLGGHMKLGDYQQNMVCLSDWRRRGAAYDLAPLARQLPLAAPPEWRPLPRATLDAAFTLAPGGYRLSEADKGDPLQTGLGGYGTPVGTAASGGTAISAGAAAGATAGAPAPTKIKLKVKLGGIGGGGGGTKRRRDGSEGPAG